MRRPGRRTRPIPSQPPTAERDPRGVLSAVQISIDHVAVATGNLRSGLQRWRTELGCRRYAAYDPDGEFRARELAYAKGAKLELLAPCRRPDRFVSAFLQRFGAAIHHMTLKVPDVAEAVAEATAAGLLQPARVDLERWNWHEAFMRPSQVGGIVVQLAWSALSRRPGARRIRGRTARKRPPISRFHGAVLAHADLDRAAGLWTLLGAQVARDGASLRGGLIVCRYSSRSGATSRAGSSDHRSR